MKIILIIAILLILIIYYFNIESKIINKLIKPHNILCKVSKQQVSRPKQNNNIIIESRPKQNNNIITESLSKQNNNIITESLSKQNNNNIMVSPSKQHNNIIMESPSKQNNNINMESPSKQNNNTIMETNPIQNNNTIMETQNMCPKRDITTLEKYNNSLPYKSIKDTSKPYYHSELDYIDKSEINCCLVEKKYLPSDNSIYGGNFKYIFEKKKNDECNRKIYELNSNKQILIEGDNGWSNNNCSADEEKNMQSIGSCRNMNKECIDFVDKSYCDKARMTWSELTCSNSLPYKWIDKLKPDVNDRTNLGAVNFFPVF